MNNNNDNNNIWQWLKVAGWLKGNPLCWKERPAATLSGFTRFGIVVNWGTWLSWHQVVIYPDNWSFPQGVIIYLKLRENMLINWSWSYFFQAKYQTEENKRRPRHGRKEDQLLQRQSVWPKPVLGANSGKTKDGKRINCCCGRGVPGWGWAGESESDDEVKRKYDESESGADTQQKWKWSCCGAEFPKDERCQDLWREWQTYFQEAGN